MLRFRASTSASQGYHYFSKSDSGLDPDDLRKQVGGKAADLLGLSDTPDFDQFKRILHGLDPHTGDQLTAKLIENRISYWDVTASVPKGVTIAIEHGDSRVHDALWEAGRETMADLERLVTTRMRKGGAQDDRVTGNMIWYGFEHPETRPNREDGMPDPDRHIHFVLPNLTYDPVEKEWKAIKFRPIMDLRKYFDRRFDMRLASKLTDLGYSVETKYKSDDRGGKRYFSWDIKDMPQSAVKKYSRRGAEVDDLAERLGIESATSKDKLGATSRLHKRDDMTLEEYRKYWLSRLTDREKRDIAMTISAANLGENPDPTNTADKGVAYAIAHHFERQSVIDWHDLAVTAMERCMGGAKPEEIEAEARKQGVLLKDGMATTKDVLAEEGRIIDFAREGKGTMRPLVAGPDKVRTIPAIGFTLNERSKQADTATLSPEQQAMVSHVLNSPDQMMLVIGDAGTGKTRSLRTAFDAIDKPVEMLAPSSAASRGVLRDEGFKNADTVASFLLSSQRQAAVKGGVIWVDEAGLLPIRDLSCLTEIARQQNARLVLQGDPKQHHSPARHGNMMNVLQEYAGLPVGRLTEIWRQKHKGYKAVVADVAAGKGVDGFDKLNELGWVKQVEGNSDLVDDYMEALATKKSGQADKDRVIVVAPTHAEGNEITAEIRSRLKEAGKLGKEDTPVEQLVNLNWTGAQKGDLHQYEGTETLVFHRNSGTFKAGNVVRITDFKKGMHWKSPEHFSVYRREQMDVAAGDSIRLTANVKDAQGNRLDNGTFLTVKAVTDKGIEAVTAGGLTRVLPLGVGHLDHGYVSTSYAGQGKTVDKVLIAMGSESIPAINAEQFYVSVSRGRHSAQIYSNLAADQLRETIVRADARRSATELMNPKPKPKRRGKLREFMKKAREGFKVLQELAIGDTRDGMKQKEKTYGGYER